MALLVEKSSEDIIFTVQLRFYYKTQIQSKYNPDTVQIQSYSSYNSVQLQSLQNYPEGLGKVLQFCDLKNKINTTKLLDCYWVLLYRLVQ